MFRDEDQMNVKYDQMCARHSYLLVQVSPHVALFILRRATVCFQNLLSGLILYPQSLDSKPLKQERHLLCVLRLPPAHMFPNPTPPICTLLMLARTPPQPPTNLAASAALRGVKQTVIDLRRDCLFCLGADDG